MIEIFNEFILNLNIPKNVLESLKKERNIEELTVFALSLPDIKYPDTYILSGRIYIYVKTISSPRTIEEYVKVLDKILKDEIKSFLLNNSELLNRLLEETYFYNFKDHNILSASSCVNYLLKPSNEENPIETPCQMYLRQAVQFYYKDSLEEVVKCYRELIYQHYIHASPTMFNASTRKNQMSSCFLLTLGDSLESLLYSGAGDVGMISKLQGGIGLSMNAVRHSQISNSGKSSGVMPFGKIYDATIKCVDQGGKRNGAMTITLNDWHIDFQEFIVSRDNYTQNGIRFKQANICAFISDLFMQRVSENKEWTLFCPAKARIGDNKLLGKNGKEFEDLYIELEKISKTKKLDLEKINEEIKKVEIELNNPNEEIIDRYHRLVSNRISIRKNIIDYKVVNARDVYNTLCDMNLKSSMPYIVYRDTVNYKNNMKNIGPCEGLNLCLEITEPSSPDSIASCNLGHLNLKKFVKTEYINNHNDIYKNLNDSYDFELLGQSVQSLVRNLNKVIDYNYYPLDVRDKVGNVTERGKISIPNFQNRPLGIGVSGLSEVFALHQLEYSSEEAIVLNKMISSCMYYNSLLESMVLAKKDGKYENFDTGESSLFVNGEWKKLKGSPMSNGFLQFDMWEQEANYLNSIGRLNTKIYNTEDNKPIEPTSWGQEGSWDLLKKNIIVHGVRNSMLTALMPTASSAQLLRNAETTEAHQTLMYSRKLSHGNYTSFSEPFVDDMVKNLLWNQETIDFLMLSNGSIKDLLVFVKKNQQYFPGHFYDNEKLKPEVVENIKSIQKIHKGMYEISQKVTIQMARQRGIYIDQSQSLNIYIAEPTIDKMKAVHSYSKALQLKTGMYYLRQNPASQTSRFTVDLKIQKFYSDMTSKRQQCTEDVCLMCQ